jgi:hypothetical protein
MFKETCDDKDIVKNPKYATFETENADEFDFDSPNKKG